MSSLDTRVRKYLKKLDAQKADKDGYSHLIPLNTYSTGCINSNPIDIINLKKWGKGVINLTHKNGKITEPNKTLTNQQDLEYVRQEFASKTFSINQIVFEGDDGTIHFVLHDIKLVLFNEPFNEYPNYTTLSFQVASNKFVCDSRIVDRLKPPKLNFQFLNKERGVLWEFEQINIDNGSSWYEMYVQCDTIESRFYKRGVESDIYDETNSVRFPGAKGYVYTC